MTLLITGATGFVMSVLARHWLDTQPQSRAVVLDVAPLDAAATRYFAPVQERLSVVVADVTRPDTWRDALDRHDITHIVHGATITPISRGTVHEARREPEAENPSRILHVNMMGTVALLEWARTRPVLQRFIYVSSGAVYKHHGPDRPGEPLPEDGYVMPRTLYGVSKLASELVTERYGELFRMSTASVRLASVYGTMDRPTASRTFRHGPNRVASMAMHGDKVVRVNTLDAVGDYIHAEDVAPAIVALLQADRLRYSAYNIGSGCTTRLGDLIQWAAEKKPGFQARIVAAEEADVVQDPTRTGGMWGAYDISRIQAQTGWNPRPVRQAFHAYMDWIAGAGRVTHDDPYPRDLLGYAGSPPDPQWPGSARIAVSMVLNYEEGGEYNILHGDAHSEYVLTDVGAEPLAGARNPNVESMFEYGSRVGVWEILRILQERRVATTVYAVGMALERNPPLAAALAASSFEVACHGYRWIDYQSVPEVVERADIERNIEVITRLIGRRPVGWYTGRPSSNTRRLVAEAGGFAYDSDAYNDDLPYWVRVGEDHQLIVPYTFDCNDSRLQRGGDFATSDEFFNYCRDAFDWLYQRGGDGNARMLSIGLHARIIGRPGRLAALQRLLDHIQRCDGVWLSERASIAAHWRSRFPAPARLKMP